MRAHGPCYALGTTWQGYEKLADGLLYCSVCADAAHGVGDAAALGPAAVRADEEQEGGEEEEEEESDEDEDEDDEDEDEDEDVDI